MQESVRRFRFGLPSLLILPLWVSPLFLSTVFVREQLARNSPSAALFFNMLACTAAYAAFFTARSRCRLDQRDPCERSQAGRRHVLPAAWRGALFGLLFMVQIVVPLLTSLVTVEAQRHDVSLADFVYIEHRWVLEAAAGMLGMLGLLGLFLGAFGGSLVGLVFDRRFARRSPMKMAGRKAELSAGDTLAAQPGR
ncbi:MAG TPA: hypothetical protein VG826_33910 [Pirellulales bacterium]|nr:hypothetical protein [Pirellulales bacterium]